MGGGEERRRCLYSLFSLFPYFLPFALAVDNRKEKGKKFLYLFPFLSFFAGKSEQATRDKSQIMDERASKEREKEGGKSKQVRIRMRNNFKQFVCHTT